MKKQEKFYWFNNKENIFIEAHGEKLNINGYECFILIAENTYSIIEGKTGSFLIAHMESKEMAIESAKNTINMFSEKMDELIQQSIDKIGMSPLYHEKKQSNDIIEQFKEIDIKVKYRDGYGDPSKPYWSASIGDSHGRILKIK